MSLYDLPELYDEIFPAESRCVGFYAELARRSGGPVLELACGTGQLLRPISEAGVAVVGLDLSWPMLAAAHRRSSAPKLLLADMCRFDLRATFPLIFVARNSLLHLTEAGDVSRCLRAVRAHLAPDGVFAFDVFNPNEALLGRRRGVRWPVMRRQTARFGEVLVEETVDYDPATQVNHATWYVSAAGEPVGRFPLHLRSIFPDELRDLVRRAGFEIESVSGDYDRTPFAPDAPRQVVVCRRMKERQRTRNVSMKSRSGGASSL